MTGRLNDLAIRAIGCLALAVATPAFAHDTDPSNWLYVVKSKSTDPAREADYNAWYTDIDIPDVLEVRGFRRARRVVASERTRSPSAAYTADGDYVAIYDIETPDIDKTIIDLYVGARRMSWRGRTTDLLKVTEANYYRAVWQQKTSSAAGTHVRLIKVNCCKQEGDRQRFGQWLQLATGSALSSDLRISRIALYDLYRIMETEALPEDEIPHLLVLIEGSATDAGKPLVSEIMQNGGQAVADDSRLYSVFNTQFAKPSN